MERAARHRTIVRALGRSRTSVGDLVQLTGASPITIRRDLADLEGQGQLRRVHGGAVATGTRGQPMPYTLRSSEDPEQKASLGEHVAGLIPDDTSVIIDNGTTNDAVARALAGRPLTVLCMSLHAALPLAMAPNAAGHVIVPGGLLTPQSLSSSTSSAIDAVRDMRADIAVIGACAVSEAHGLTASTWDDAQVKRAIVASASRRILVSTGRKLARTSSFRFAAIDDIDDLVTTDDAPTALLDHFRAAGTTVHVVPARQSD